MINPKSGIIAHITLSILCIDAFSLSFCFYWRLFVRFFLNNGSVPKSVSGKNPLKFVNFKCHCKFNVLFLIVL